MWFLIIKIIRDKITDKFSRRKHDVWVFFHLIYLLKIDCPNFITLSNVIYIISFTCIWHQGVEVVVLYHLIVVVELFMLVSEFHLMLTLPVFPFIPTIKCTHPICEKPLSLVVFSTEPTMNQPSPIQGSLTPEYESANVIDQRSWLYAERGE